MQVLYIYIDSRRLVQKRLLIVFFLHYCCFRFILDGKNIPGLLPLFVPVYNMPALKLQKRSTRWTRGSIINILQGMETFVASMLNTELKIDQEASFKFWSKWAVECFFNGSDYF